MGMLKHYYRVYCDNRKSLRQTWFTYNNGEYLKEHIIRFVRDEMARLLNEGYAFVHAFESDDVEDAICIAGVKNNKLYISRVFVRRVED